MLKWKQELWNISQTAMENMKHYKPLAWMMAIAIASTMTTACSLDGNEPEKPFGTCPAHDASLYACGISHYYLHDCYPPQFIDNDEVKANIQKNAAQWELFTYYLESIGKIRR